MCIDRAEALQRWMWGASRRSDAGDARCVFETERGSGLPVNSFNSIEDDVKLGANVRLSKFITLYGCEIGDETKIGAFVEIQKNAKVGNRCKISSHSFLCEG